MGKGKNVVKKYIDRRILDSALIDIPPLEGLDLIIVVPAYKESLEDLLMLCSSLENQSSKHGFELIIVINNPISDTGAFELNQKVLSSKQQFNKFDFPIHFIDKTNLADSKKTGVGLARKIGLDEGLRRFDSMDKDGILVCLDADCVVAPTYLEEIIQHFSLYPKFNAVSIGFKHRIDELKDSEEYEAIIDYELHLRYYIHIQSWLDLPFAFQTVGSAIAVRSDAYAAEGGMPVLQAGEDFYFLHKFIRNDSCNNLAKAIVFPSGRVSDRVPFGTGRAVGDMLKSDLLNYKSYNPKSFVLLKSDLDTIFSSYPNFDNIEAKLNKQSYEYFESGELKEKLNECLANTSSKTAFTKRFYQWFDAFRLMKYLHFMRDIHFQDLDLMIAVEEFLKLSGSEFKATNALDALVYFQNLDYP